ncbi:MAG TPA: YciI family protein [Jatrophihabitans sp.]|nr:YciI family protein [Jatrophihabitans sp.]
MKYVILIHSNPDPWGHPTSRYTAEGRAISPERHEAMDREFDELLAELSASGEFVTAEALADPASSTIYTWGPDGHLATDGPYAEAKEQLAGFFLIDCQSRERAEQIAAQFAGPGSTVELRPAMWPGADDQ